MAIKFDRLFERFDEKGITTYTLRQKKIVGNETLRKLKNNTGVIDTRTIDKLCDTLDCQPGDIMSFEREDVLQKALAAFTVAPTSKEIDAE